MFSRVDQKSHIDFSVTFSDCQEIQLLRKRLRSAQSALSGGLEVTSGYEDILICRDTQECMSTDSRTMSSELKSYEAQLRAHLRSVTGLLDSSADDSNIVRLPETSDMEPRTNLFLALSHARLS